MKTLRQRSSNALVLLACLALGGLCGLFAPPAGTLAYLIGQVYLAVVNMAVAPLLVVATFFGLRQIVELPRPWLRIGMIGVLAAMLVGVCAFVGTLAGFIVMPGQHLSAGAYAQLGELVLHGHGGNVGVSLYGASAPAAASAPFGAQSLHALFPDNFYAALAEGRPIGALIGTILFGLAFATIPRDESTMLNAVFEGVYRAFEAVIDHANLLLPVLAFGSAAYLSAHTEGATLAAMSGFLGCFALLAIGLCALALAAIAAQARLPFWRVLMELRSPLLVGLVSGNETAAIPHMIEALSTRLGFSRGVVELVVPLGAVFLRAGSALYFALVATFVANLYQQTLDAADLMMIGGASVAAAFASAGRSGALTFGFAGIVLALLRLPVEAVGVLFVAIDLLCEGLRNLTSQLAVCALVAWVSAGLPAERRAADDPVAPAAALPVRQFVFSRAQLVMATGCALTVASLVVLLGIGVGAR